MGCIDGLSIGLQDEIAALIDSFRDGKRGKIKYSTSSRDRNNVIMRLASTSPTNCHYINMRRIEGVLLGVYGNVERTTEKTAGMRSYCYTANYYRDKEISTVFVDVSLEEKDKGKVLVSASNDQLERIRDSLESALNIKLDTA